eukprot:4360906-Lingulodinium_polyedra.AAC.1
MPPHNAVASKGSEAFCSTVRACLAFGDRAFQSLLSATVRPHAKRAPALTLSDSVHHGNSPTYCFARTMERTSRAWTATRF